jgi:hypothetical protein
MNDKVYADEGIGAKGAAAELDCTLDSLPTKFILDACCGGRMMWFDKHHPNALYIDIRDEDRGCISHRPQFEVKPDMIMDFRKLDFPDGKFRLVVWDPPHLKTLGKNSYYGKKFGCLNAETWQTDLSMGFKECWRVLADYGVLIFKWSESEISLSDVLKLFKERPLFGQTGKNSKTIWVCFMKIPRFGTFEVKGGLANNETAHLQSADTAASNSNSNNGGNNNDNE